MANLANMGSTMESVELRNLDEASDYILQGLWLQRVVQPNAALVRSILEWVIEIASSGQSLPPVGFVADLGVVAFGLDRGRPTKDHPEVPGWPSTLARRYEDHLLGKVYADWSFERATDALRRLTGRDQAKGLAYVVRQIRERAGLGGAELSPAILRGMLGQSGESLLARGYTSLSENGPMPLLLQQYESLTSAARRLADLLCTEDIIALEQRTALADMGQYVAHRQILQMTARIEARLPLQAPRPFAGRKEVPTRILDEDQYPVGGYSSISSKGSVESLLHSQLAFIDADSPDLFDLKYVRDELFYYSRDENQFLRRRRTFAFVIYPDLVTARFKDPDLPTQRIVLALATIVTLIRRVTEWLSTDALRFEVLFVRAGTEEPLVDEVELLQIILREPIERGDAEVKWYDNTAAVTTFLATQAAHSQIHCLTLASSPVQLSPDGVVVSHLTVAGSRPTLIDGHGHAAQINEEDPFDHWLATAKRLLELWV